MTDTPQKKTRKSKHLHIRISEEEKRIIELGAEAAKLDPSEFVRTQMIEAAKDVLEKAQGSQ
jgi:uncharacterized protein (DUF1778 family)